MEKKDESVPKVRVRIYVDGLNFYYNVARPFDIKWIDIEGLLGMKLAEFFGHEVEVEHVYLFTALVKGSGQRKRQKKYLKALKHFSDGLTIVDGEMQQRYKKVRIVSSLKQAKAAVREEKQTDVSIACAIVDDSCERHGKEFDVACLVAMTRTCYRCSGSCCIITSGCFGSVRSRRPNHDGTGTIMSTIN